MIFEVGIASPGKTTKQRSKCSDSPSTSFTLQQKDVLNDDDGYLNVIVYFFLLFII